MPLSQPIDLRFDGGTPGATIPETGTAQTAAGTTTFIGSGPVYSPDGNQLRPNPSTSGSAQSSGRATLASNSKFGQFTGIWTPVALPSAATTPMVMRSNAAPVGDLLWNTNGTIRLRENGLSTTWATTLNEKYLIQWAADIGSSTTNGRIRTKITRLSDNVVLQDAEATNRDFITSHTSFLYGAFGRGTSATQDSYWDNVRVWDGAYALLDPLSDTTIVNAGQDQANILPYQMVTLAGTSTGAAPTSWNWTQTAGPTVTLSGSGANRTFVAPAMPDDVKLTFSLTATTGGVTSAADTVDIFVQNHNNFKAIGGSWTGIRLNRLNSI